MSQIKLLNRQKGHLKAQATKLESFLENIDLHKLDKPLLFSKLETIQRMKSALDTLRSQYYEHEEDEHLEDQDKQLEEMDDRMEAITLELRRLSSISQDEQSWSHSVHSASRPAQIKLPEIPLPSFTGRFDEWNSFKKEFDSLITISKDLSDMQKLHYLKAALSGSAKQVQSADDTFSSLYEALSERFSNKRLISESHINIMLNLRRMSIESSRDLHHFLDSIIQQVRALKLMDLHVLEGLKSIKGKRVSSKCEKSSALVTNSPVSNQECLFCSNTSHSIYSCKNFKALPVAERLRFAKQKRLCFNCLKTNHQVSNCKSRLCSICHKKHNTLLHALNVNDSIPKSPEPQQVDAINKSYISPTLAVVHQHRDQDIHKQVMLSTAIVYVSDIQGLSRPCRALLDSASQSSFITVECANALGLNKKRVDVSVSGFNGATVKVRNLITTTISNKKDFNKVLSFLLVPKITGMTPARYIDISSLNIPSHLKLADPQFSQPRKVDMLIGAELFYELLMKDNHNLIRQPAYLHGTVFGWVVGGLIDVPSSESNSTYCNITTSDEAIAIDTTLRRFWEIESISQVSNLKSEEENYCEQHFLENYIRNNEGRFVVKLPIKSNVILSDTAGIAKRRLETLWFKLSKDAELKQKYCEFMQDYEKLGHMQRVDKNDGNVPAYYIPHHGIFKKNSSTAKLRVVFDASAASGVGESLNASFLNGGVVQKDLFSIILNFRTFKYAITADVVKMYRQILVKPAQCNLQRIFWKKGLNSEILTYKLNTLTYGTKCAPFLATRVLNQLATDEQKRFPLACDALLNSTYVDDVLCGADTLQQAMQLKDELIDLLETAGMSLHKWCASNDVLLEGTSSNILDYCFKEKEDFSIKTLGLIWHPKPDYFGFSLNISDDEVINYTKRNILSAIARLYDPLGILGPVITLAKLFIKNLWLKNLEWDQLIPKEDSIEWRRFITSLSNIINCKIQRYVLCDNIDHIQIHGFADASQSAFGAVLYLRSISKSQTVSMRLVCSKSRVSPVKTVTLPRLELCAAMLLAQLTHKVATSLTIKINSVHLWSDSSVTLTWIKTFPHLLKTFVANRVSAIQDITSTFSWHHIRSQENPADLLSRGVMPDLIESKDLWWHGPSFLSNSGNFQSNELKFHCQTDKAFKREFKKEVSVSMTVNNKKSIIQAIIDRNSSFLRLTRICAYLLRYIYNLQHTNSRRYGPLSCVEFKEAQSLLIKEVQQEEFSKEIMLLRQGKLLNATSKLKSLNPFLDPFNLLRVGGRLSKALLSYDQQHQLILPAKHRLTSLIFDHYHKINLHIGRQALLHLVRQRFWPLRGKVLASKTVRSCVACFKARPKDMNQLMGQLPLDRVLPNTPFTISVVDFCGPFSIKFKGQRKGPLKKIYVALFICFATKAIHLEIVSDLSADAFIACLKRFFARRGKSRKLYSDNATNFTGANNELKRLSGLIKEPHEKVAEYLSSEQIEWKFIPPYSPNQGGLWEAGVKAFKYHLKSTGANSSFTFEEFNTLVIQIEGILNSRPITPLSSDLDEFEALTPGHFLVGKHLNNIQEPDLTQLQDNRLSKWQRTTKAVQAIWSRWYRDYLHQLQQRSKWQTEKENVYKGALVVIKNNNLPVNKWLLGRVEDLLPGKDGKVRIVTVKTKKGIIKRAVSRICLLPVNIN